MQAGDGARGNDAAKGQWIVNADSARKMLNFTSVQAQDIAASKSLQLWAICAGAKPISLGLLKSSGPTLLTVSNVTLSPESAVAIRLEPQGGSPTGSVVFSGAL